MKDIFGDDRYKAGMLINCDAFGAERWHWEDTHGKALIKTYLRTHGVDLRPISFGKFTPYASPGKPPVDWHDKTTGLHLGYLYVSGPKEASQLIYNAMSFARAVMTRDNERDKEGFKVALQGWADRPGRDGSTRNKSGVVETRNSNLVRKSIGSPKIEEHFSPILPVAVAAPAPAPVPVAAPAVIAAPVARSVASDGSGGREAIPRTAKPISQLSSSGCFSDMSDLKRRPSFVERVSQDENASRAKRSRVATTGSREPLSPVGVGR